MNFLPFVFTFLLLLTFISSFLFSSVMGTAREKKVILTQRYAYLQLLSEQNKELFDSKKEKTPVKPNNNGPRNVQNKPPNDEGIKPRSSQEGCEKSKLCLTLLMSSDQPLLQKTVEEAAIRLIDILYGSFDFYSKAKIKGIARTIVKQIAKDKIECFEELKFGDKDLNGIYYKMLKGTNTGYPALSEYFTFSKQLKLPIYFRFASKPVLRAALGEEFAKSIFDLELEQWNKNKRRQVMTKQDFISLKKNQHSHLAEIIDFDNKNKGPVQIHQESTEKIRAIHPVEKVDL